MARVLAWHARGPGFESPYLHQTVWYNNLMTEQSKTNNLIAEWDADGNLSVKFEPTETELYATETLSKKGYEREQTLDPNGSRSSLRRVLARSGMDIHFWGD